MNAITPSAKAILEAQRYDGPIAGVPMVMGSNVARDFKSRASDFKSSASALYEYVVNAYEGYDFDQHPVVKVTVKGAKILIEDSGVGMSLEKLAKFWTMHGNTERRENGRNKRGYHGSGKSAYYAFADHIHVRSVKDGLANSMSLACEEVEEAAAMERPLFITPHESNLPVDEPNGTQITISRLRQKFTAEDVRALRDKIAENMRMFMTGAEVIVNGVRVEERPVNGVTHEVASPCGTFTATIIHNDAGHSHDDDRVFFSVGGVYVAAMQTGKEGHRFSHQVSVMVDTTPEWAADHFENRREKFMSEARDLVLKTSDPAAKALHDFAEGAVRDFMKKLDEADAERKKEKASEAELRLVTDMSRVLSALVPFGGASPRSRKEQHERAERVQAERTRNDSGKGRNPSDRKPKVTFGFKHFDMLEAPYQIERDTMTVYFNKSSKVVASLSQEDTDSVRNAVLWGIAGQAVCELAVEQAVAEHEQNEGPVSVRKAMEMHGAKWSEITNAMSAIYAGFLDQAPSA